MSQFEEAVLIVNAKSRKGQTLFKQARETLEAKGIKLAAAWEMEKPEEVMAKAKEATARSVPLVIVGGGDGTLSGVTKYFIGSRSTLGVLPLGTGNEFARDLGIASDVEKACIVIAEGRAFNVDVGTISGRYFLNVASIGLTTLVAQDLNSREKRVFGRFAYVAALARALTQVRPFRVTLTLPEGVQSFETLQVVVGNGRYHAGPFPLAPNATITDGKLTAYVVATTSKWGLLQFALRLPGGHHVDLKEVPTFEVDKIEISAAPQQRVTVDGEVSYKTPQAFGVAPQALRVMAPSQPV